MSMKTANSEAKRANRIRMKAFLYGQAQRHEFYAVAVVGDQTWAACEVDGLFYQPCVFDDIPEDNWDRITALEQRVIGVKA